MMRLIFLEHFLWSDVAMSDAALGEPECVVLPTLNGRWINECVETQIYTAGLGEPKSLLVGGAVDWEHDLSCRVILSCCYISVLESAIGRDVALFEDVSEFAGRSGSRDFSVFKGRADGCISNGSLVHLSRALRWSLSFSN